MKVNVNGQDVTFDGCTVGDLIESLSLRMEGCAVAIEARIIPATRWETEKLNEGDKVTIILSLIHI